jgi:hypothetical protein
MARIQPALAQRAVDAACRAMRTVFPLLADGFLLAVQLPDSAEPWLVHACGDRDGDVFALQLLTGADALQRLHESQEPEHDLRGRMLLVAFLPRGELVDRLREVADAAKFTEHLVPSFSVVDGTAAPRVPDAATLRQLVAILGALVRAADAGELPSTPWRRRGGVHVPLLRVASEGSAAPEVLPAIWFDAPAEAPRFDVAALAIGDAEWSASIVGMYDPEAKVGDQGLAMLMVKLASGSLHGVVPIDGGVTLAAAARDALVQVSPTEIAAGVEVPRLPARIACADERLRAAFVEALAGRPVEVVVDPSLAAADSATAASGGAAAGPAAAPADGDVAAWRSALQALLQRSDDGHDVPPRPVRARFLGEGPLLARDADLPDELIAALRLYQFVFDRPRRGLRTHAEREAERSAELAAGERAWLAALAACDVGVWCCEQDDGERVVVREALSGERAVVAKARAVGLPATGEAVGAVRVELGGGSWWLPLSPRLPTVAMLQALAVVGGGRRIDAELLRRDLGLFGRLWSMDERADGAP